MTSTLSLASIPKWNKRHFKLWLTSVEALETVLNNDVFVRTQGFEDPSNGKLKIYVQKRQLSCARASDSMNQTL